MSFTCSACIHSPQLCIYSSCARPDAPVLQMSTLQHAGQASAWTTRMRCPSIKVILTRWTLIRRDLRTWAVLG